MRQQLRRFWPFALGAAVIATVAIFASRGGDERVELTTNEFLDRVDAGEVVTAEIGDRSNRVRGELADGSSYEATFVAEFADELQVLLNDADPPIEVSVDRESQSVWVTLLFSLLPLLLLVVVFIVILNMFQGGGRGAMKFGRSKAKRLDPNQPTVTFGDVAGADEAVAELAEIRDFLADPEKFRALGATIPRGVLLVGPPGTGKTLLARAVAGEAGVPFFTISGSDFVEMFVGVGASRVRDLFQQAKREAPAIVFVDEIDAVGRHRGAGLGGGHDEREQTLNQLLVEMDGFDPSSGVIMIAATNRPDILDPALLRPGRFDRQIVVDAPDREGRAAIFTVHAKGKPLADDVDPDVIAGRIPGFTGADIANLLNEAALLAARRDREIVTAPDIDDAIDRIIAGPERRTRVLSDGERSVIAYHEAGHALVGHVLPSTDPIRKVSIVARGRALGWTLAVPEADRYLRSASELRDDLAMLLGGRSAEEIVFGETTTGAANDIERATDIARAMVTEYGMSDELGPLRLGRPDREVFLGREMTGESNYSDSVAAAIDREVRSIVEGARDRAHAAINDHRSVLDALAAELLRVETVEGESLSSILAGAEDRDDGEHGGTEA